jgi:hypothetical protein
MSSASDILPLELCIPHPSRKSSRVKHTPGYLHDYQLSSCNIHFRSHIFVYSFRYSLFTFFSSFL